MLIVGLIMAVYAAAFLAYVVGRYTDLGIIIHVRWLNLVKPLNRFLNRGRY